VSSSPGPPSRIVVGVDGSTSSAQAVRWAARQADLTGAEVHAVITWHLPTTTGWETTLDAVDWEGDAGRTLDAALAEALPPAEAERVHRHVVEGHPAKVLAERSAGADLLVVGSRGHGGFTGMLLGSVGLHVLAHATCPVVVVRGNRLPPTPGGKAAVAGTATD
jgi:nucleotide-binding universal stress UspA family protein